MPESTRSTVVDAPAARVLAVVEDLEAYPEWAGSVQRAEVLERGADGRPSRARLTLEGGPLKDTCVLGYVWAVSGDGTGRVSWHLLEKGSLITRLDGAYTLEAGPGVGGGRTRVTHELLVDVRVPMLRVLRRRAETTIIGTALAELSRRAAT